MLPSSRLFPWCAAVLLLVLPACGSSDDGGSGRGGGWGGGRGGADSTPSVDAVEARYGSLPLRERLSGTVRAMNQVAIYPEIDAPVVEVIAQSGDYVEQGAPLVRLRNDTYRERVRQAKASLKVAQADAKSARATLRELEAQLRRTQQLAENQYESEQRLETLKAQVESAEAAVERADAQVEQAQATLDEREADLRQTVVRAPTSGHVGERNVEIGQRVSGSTRLYTLGDLSTVKVNVQVTDKMFGQIRKGQTVRINASSIDTTLTASVTRMSPFLSDDSYSAEAEIEVSNEEQILRPGMFVEVDVLYGESQQATLVPMSALYENPNTGERGIFVAPTLGTEIPVETPDSFDADNPPSLTQATPTTFRAVDIVAEGRMVAGVRGIEPGTWVVTVGQNLLSTAGTDRVDARVRPLPWSRITALQRLQDGDLLQRMLDRQQRMAKERFADSTSSSTAASAPETPPDTSGLASSPPSRP